MAIPTDDAEGPQRCMRLALADAGVEPPRNVDYVNAHATSTPAGRPRRGAYAIRAVFGAHAEIASRVSCDEVDDGPPARSGGCGGGAVLRPARSRPVCFRRPSTSTTPIRSAISTTWPTRPARRRQVCVALSNSFGFGGTNATLVFGRASGAAEVPPASAAPDFWQNGWVGMQVWRPRRSIATWASLPIVMAADHRGVRAQARAARASRAARATEVRRPRHRAARSPSTTRSSPRRRRAAVSEGKADPRHPDLRLRTRGDVHGEPLPGVRAALVQDVEAAEMARLHNDANVLALSGDRLDADRAAWPIVRSPGSTTPFEGGRHVPAHPVRSKI